MWKLSRSTNEINNCLDIGIKLLNHESDISLYDSQPADQELNKCDSGCSTQGSSPSSSESFQSTTSDEAFDELFDINSSDKKDCKLPTEFDNLIDGPITEEMVLIGQDHPVVSLTRGSNLHTPVAVRNDDKKTRFKRLASLDSNSSLVKKCLKLGGASALEFSDQAVVESALQRSSTDPYLVGDCSRAFRLPLTLGRHRDLKSISTSTLAALMNGKFNNEAVAYQIIDCRFPYEFKGGHIRNAINLYSKELIVDNLIKVKDPNRKRPDILIFHCEFSSCRAPTLYRFLRNFDRAYNADIYPSLYYPELYLLDGGYQSFYKTHADLCEPEAYVPMNDGEYKKQLSHFKNLSVDKQSKTSPVFFKRLNFNIS